MKKVNGNICARMKIANSVRTRKVTSRPTSTVSIRALGYLAVKLIATRHSQTLQAEVNIAQSFITSLKRPLRAAPFPSPYISELYDTLRRTLLIKPRKYWANSPHSLWSLSVCLIRPHHRWISRHPLQTRSVTSHRHHRLPQPRRHWANSLSVCPHHLICLHHRRISRHWHPLRMRSLTSHRHHRVPHPTTAMPHSCHRAMYMPQVFKLTLGLYTKVNFYTSQHTMLLGLNLHGPFLRPPLNRCTMETLTRIARISPTLRVAQVFRAIRVDGDRTNKVRTPSLLSMRLAIGE